VSYDRLEAEAEGPPRKIVDHSAKWEALAPLRSVNGHTQELLERFCASKRITLAALEELGARVALRKGGKVELAFAGTNGAGAIVALKYRPLSSSHESRAERPSTWLRPIIAGKRDSLDWIVVEGETDGARLVGLVGDLVAVLVLPAGARAFKREWAAAIPRGAWVGLAHDADRDGDAGAQKAAALLGGRTVRLRPPVEGGDWCDWNGSREDFLELLHAARSEQGANDGRILVARLKDVEMREVEYVERPLLQRDAFILLSGRPGIGKGALGAHWAARCSNGEMYGQPRNAIVIASEDSDEIDLKPRIVVAGGDAARVFSVKGGFRLPGDALWLCELAEKIGDVGLIVIDPLGNHTGEANTDRESDVRQALMPLVGVALELRCPLVGVRHVTTKASPGGALGKILGSTAWIAVPRAILIAALDAEGILHVRDRKANRVPPSEAGSSFRIEGRFPPGFKESVACVVPLGASDADVDELLSGGEQESRSSSSSAEARELILDLLDAHGELESDELDKRVAEQTGLKAQTIRNLRSDLRGAGLIRSRPEREETGFGIKRWFVVRTNASRARARGGAETVSTTTAIDTAPTPTRARAREGGGGEARERPLDDDEIAELGRLSLAELRQRHAEGKL
jgi:hypothetical protein